MERPASLLLLLSVAAANLQRASAQPAHTDLKPSSSLDASALSYLQRYGYMAAPKSAEADSLVSEESFAGAVSSFQQFAGLPATGRVDADTWSLMRLPRCGNRDRAPRRTARRRRYALQGSKWRRQELTYRISQYPSRFVSKKREVEAQIERAFALWSAAAPVDFVAKREGRVHIDIRFASGDHGDGDAFDGPGNTLAHAYFPQYGGDAHFDDQEFWTVDSHAGTNIFQVAAHELGHSLGLGHSGVREALMAPFYQKYKPDFRLHPDDVLAIRALYGEKPATPASTSTPTSTPTTTAPPPSPPVEPERRRDSEGVAGEPDLCADASIDAATRTEDGNSYVFKGDLYWLLSADGIAKGYPRRIERDWEGLPGKLDAALTWADGKTFFFKGNKYWRYRNRRRDLGYPKLISAGFAGIPDNLDAALVWAGNGRTYFFKGAQYWRFDSKQEPPVAADYPRPLSVWQGVPAGLDAALRWENNVTYFFKGAHYWRFNDKDFRVETRGRPPFPRASAEWWFGCLAASLSAAREEPAGEQLLEREPASPQPPADWALLAGLESPRALWGSHVTDQRPPTSSAISPFALAGHLLAPWLSLLLLHSRRGLAM